VTALRRWLSIPVVLLALGAGLLVVRFVVVRRNVDATLGDDLRAPLRVADVEIDAWQMALAHRVRIAAELLSSAAPISDSAFDRVARAVAATDSATLWVATANGVVRRSYGQQRLSSTVDSSASAFLTIRCGEVFCAEARQSIHDGSLIVGLRVPINDRTFPFLDSPGRLRDSRATLLLKQRDSVFVVASVAHDSTPLPTRALSWAEAPAPVRGAFGDGKSAGAADRGLVHERVLFATRRYPKLGWVLLREIRGDELLERLVGPMIIDVLFAAGLLLLAVAYVRSRMRVTAMRREHELATMRSNFVAAVSHELRTPLAQIKLFAELLRKGSLRGAGEVERAWNVIDKESGRLGILVDNVLSHARSASGNHTRSDVGQWNTDVSRDVAYVIDAFTPFAAEKDARIMSEVAAGVVASIDSQSLRQILLNFLENAVKYGPRGQTVMVTAAKTEQRVRICVSDEGPGVPDAERESIWRAFERGSATHGSEIAGSGIGLSVVRDLVEQYEGTAWVEPGPTRGARFIVEFPVGAP
jgi:signal transduction histidine kinase